MTRKKNPSERKNGLSCQPDVLKCLNCTHQAWACSGGTNKPITKYEKEIMNYAHSGEYSGPYAPAGGRK